MGSQSLPTETKQTQNPPQVLINRNQYNLINLLVNSEMNHIYL